MQTDGIAMREEAMREANERLKTTLMRLAPEPAGQSTAVEGLTLTRWNAANMVDTCFYAPSVG